MKGGDLVTDNGASSYHRYLWGDTDALEELVRLFGDALVRFAYCFLGDPYAAEDVMEDCFAALIVKRKPVDDAKLKAYLFKIARNKCIDVLRARGRIAPLNEETCEAMFSDAEEDAMRLEQNKRLYAAMQKLPTQYREVLDLVYFENFSPQETAAILRKTRKQIYNLLARAKTALKEILQKEGFDL